MWSLILPPKQYPEDSNGAAAYLAKLLLGFALLSLCWVGYQVYGCVRSLAYASTMGEMVYGTVAWNVSRMSGVSYKFSVNGQEYESDNIVFGGRPLGKVPPPGPVTVYYDPANPKNSVLIQRPVETVYLALICVIGLPYVARWVWTMA